MCSLLAGKLFDGAELVNGAVVGRQAFEGGVENLLELGRAGQSFGRRRRVGDLDAVLFESRELKQGQQGLAAAQLPADAAGNASKPRAEGFASAEGVETAVGLEHCLDEHILGILAVAADAHHLPVDRVLVMAGQLFEVAVGTWRALRLVARGHRDRIDRRHASSLCRMTLAGAYGDGCGACVPAVRP